jgi:hypothetical protein
MRLLQRERSPGEFWIGDWILDSNRRSSLIDADFVWEVTLIAMGGAWAWGVTRFLQIGRPVRGYDFGLRGLRDLL